MERSGITSSNVSKERSNFQVMKDSNLHRKPKRSEMSDTERVQDFQRKIYRKAKQEKDFRFYVLYDKIRLRHFLKESYRRIKANAGAPGVDNITFEQIEKKGLVSFIDEIRSELETGSYRPAPVKRVMIPKANGTMRPLGIPTIKDRVVQMSCKLVIEPIFEADFEDSSYGFRPRRSASDAMRAIKENLEAGRTEVYDADLSSYFDTIPHAKLMKLLALRIADSRVLHLIKMWLKAPIEDDGNLRGGKKNKIGTPQGGVISPLLANIYLHLLDRVVARDSLFKKHDVKIVRYADDFLLLGRRMPEVVLQKVHSILARMELRINEEKSGIVEAKKAPFDFLGFTIRYDKPRTRNGRYWNIIPSEKSCKKLRSNLKKYLSTRGHLPPEILVKGLNPKLRGWLNYFTIEGVSRPNAAKRKLRWYMWERLYWFTKRKSQRFKRARCYKAYEVLVRHYGLIEPTKY